MTNELNDVENSPSWLMAWAGDDNAALVEVTAQGAASEAVVRYAASLAADAVASRIAAKDATLWGPEAEAESKIRLGWTELHNTTRAILPELFELRDQLAAEGIDRVVLAGMGGSSLAPEVITRTEGVPLVVLDSTEPDQVRNALAGDLSRTVLVVSSKSGGTVETDSQRRVFEAAFTAAGLDATQHIVVVTDPGSPLSKAAAEAGYRKVFLADPNVGGRFSALSAFGIVPSALAGVDVTALLDDAAAVADLFAEDSEGNPAVVLGAAMAGTTPLRDKLIFVDEGSGIVGLGDWAEQLIAESTGKSNTGVLPVVVSSVAAPEVAAKPTAADTTIIRIVALSDDGTDEENTVAVVDGSEITVAGSLGAHFLLWEYATSIAGRILGISPFDQPDVESAKSAARGLLDAMPEPVAPDLVDAGVEVRATPGLLDGVTTLEGAVDALLGQLASDGYLSVMAYLDREADAELEQARDSLAASTQRPVTFGWGPRFLHSTGQYHKGGPAQGVYLQITTTPQEDLVIPERPYTFGVLISAQATGDATVLAERGRPVLRLHLTDHDQLPALIALLNKAGR